MELDLAQIRVLLASYHNALIAEHQVKTDEARLRTVFEAMKARLIGGAYKDGTVDGKNAETRRAQEHAVLVASSEVSSAVAELETAAEAATIAEIERKCVDAELSLTRAWLYSQAPFR